MQYLATVAIGPSTLAGHKGASHKNHPAPPTHPVGAAPSPRLSRRTQHPPDPTTTTPTHPIPPTYNPATPPLPPLHAAPHPQTPAVPRPHRPRAPHLPRRDGAAAAVLDRPARPRPAAPASPAATQTAPQPARLTADELPRLGTLVNSAAHHALGPANCLTRSLYLWWLLRRRGIDSQLRIGVRLNEGVLDAHAWVEYAGVPVNDRADVSADFAPFDKPVSPSLFSSP
jgi:hypothetical protein